MPYVVRRGKVQDAERVYEVGQLLDAERGELADVEALGAVEWLTDKQAEALLDADPERKSNRELRALLAEHGVEASPRANKDELVALLRAAEAAPPHTEAEDESEEQTGGESGVSQETAGEAW